ncbi:hypothetical protein [Oribacterium sinus]|uniref:hypothetical protein n=1 Tax=Oribacterium sinus TaxID=237576 RepID=UPI0028E7D156|nr:hypothetical protein [Oribacterium sinus]
MESKALFEVETAWPFPILQYTTNTSFVEVRKASGIAYILLQLISSLENNNEKLVAMLKGLGVPHDIHYIFAGELASMINLGIIQMQSGKEFGTELIGIYRVSDFEITKLGKQLFKEGAIPTGNDKVKKLYTYYDVSRKDTLIKFDRKLFRLDNSTLDENCVGDVVLTDSDIEMFINENMNQYAFRKGERISGFEHEPPEFLVYKMDDAVVLRILEDGVQIQAKDKEQDAFIHKFYNADTVTRIISAKKKYHFSEVIVSEVEEYDYNSLTDVTRICMPSQIASVTNVKSPLTLENKCEIRGSECSIDGDYALKLMRKCKINGVACYFDNGLLYSIIPGRYLLDAYGYSGKCAINLVVVQKMAEDIKQRLMREVFLGCIDSVNPFEKCIIIKKLTIISKCKDYLEQFANALLCKTESYTEKINLFFKLNEEFINETEWKDYSQECAERLFEMLCTQITVDGFAAQNILGKKLNKIMGLNEVEYISKMSKNLIGNQEDAIVFEALEAADFSVDVILSIINIFDVYCQRIIEGVDIIGNSKLSDHCKSLGWALSELKNLTGIDNPFEGAAEMDFDQERFIQVMVTFSDSMKKIEKYKNFAREYYKRLALFQERFIEIKEVVTIEKEATKNPKNINMNYIEQMLKKSRYKDSICDLHVRLQYELNRLYNTENMSIFNLLSESNISNFLDDQEIDQMHALRKCRNGFQHPKDKRDIQYSEKTIREWCSVVEKLGGMNNEPRSEN